ncbi:hypothetical protein CCAND95_240012 [Capnocytophaga canis]|uniref:Glycosyl transferase family 1 domain-containing protein n=1 Tax=Capnocytophaga canis TaxID=1848903 RepID=A0A0B7HXF9_9FLAO|nr:glycosyltransferase [Capnocytophaga canis]CEN43420.1 hypothetical protein CCAND95_240012 [Capnocytophaga canis]CEN44376.1 hypothetical protein CCAND38_180012 [Capnocytophaga canis]
MITDKILNFTPYACGINDGGPSGVVAHNLLDKPRDFFNLSSDFINDKSFSFRVQRKLYSLVTRESYLSFLYRKIKAYRFKYVYFHDPISLHMCRKVIPNNQVVILQSYSPQLPSEEYADAFPNQIEEIAFRRSAETDAFKRADVVVFATEGCRGIYESLLSDNSDIYYTPYGAKEKYNMSSIPDGVIKEDKINLMFIGRRMPIKGFDILMNTYREVYKKRNDLNLIVLGKRIVIGNNGLVEVEKIEEEGIADVGFTKDPISWYNSVDYLINTNRQSYFDLSILEALSTGVPIIMTDNFGHNYFKDKSPLINTFDVNSPNVLSEILLGNLKKRDKNNRENRMLYESHLTDECYYKRFEQFARNLL